MGENYVFCCSSHINFNPSSHLKDFFSKCDQIRSFLQIWSHLLKKFLMGSFIFCAVWKALWQRCFWVMFQIVGHKVIKTEHSVTINSWRVVYYLWTYCVVCKMKFSIKIFFSICEPNCRFRSICSPFNKEKHNRKLFCSVAVMCQAFLFQPEHSLPTVQKMMLAIKDFFIFCAVSHASKSVMIHFGLSSSHTFFSVFQTLNSKLPLNPFTTNLHHHIETSQSICIANQLTGFYKIGNIGR